MRKALLIAIGLFSPVLLAAATVLAQPDTTVQLKVVHAYVALCDNHHQGIVPVAEHLGNGQSPRTNLYWGALYGVRTFFSRSDDWTLALIKEDPRSAVLERCVFRSADSAVMLVADAYDGREIKAAIQDFLASVAGLTMDTAAVENGLVVCGGASDMVAYVGHNGLKDHALESYPTRRDSVCRETIILACASKPYFSRALDSAGACPLLWTTGLMAPEAYTLLAAVESWAAGEPSDSVRAAAAAAYCKYQNCGLAAARRLLVGGR
ncbi:hypothetical protein GF377_02265 [candidate division GN15 bacterium]|nr:hypothetical protein [candidate division GN15 bacterium]